MAVARASARLARYPPAAKHGGERPTQKILNILKDSGTMTAEQVWTKAKPLGFPSKTYVKRLLRELHRQHRVVVRAVPQESPDIRVPFLYLYNVLKDPVMKFLPRKSEPRRKAQTATEALEKAAGDLPSPVTANPTLEQAEQAFEKVLQ